MNNTLGNNILKTFRLAFLVAIVAISGFAQATLTTTTISAAMTDIQTTVTLASATNVTIAGAANQVNTVLYIDHELMSVGSLVSGTTYTVGRGVSQTRKHAHLSGATVYLGAPTNNFVLNDYFAEPAGTCVATTLSLPRVFLKSGHRMDCLGVAGTQQWVITSNNEGPILGSTVASPAGVMTPTGTLFIVSGTNAITGITVPNGAASGFQLTLLPTGAATTTTATNIAIASTMVVGKALIMTWNGTTSKWYPSY